MRYTEIIEAVSYTDILARVNIQLHHVVEQFLKKTMNEFRMQGVYYRREKLGYHPYLDDSPGYKKFNQDEFDRANQDWSVDADYIGDELSKLIPDPTTEHQTSPVYRLMVQLSNELTKIVQDEIKSKYGKKVYLHKNKFEQDVSNIRVHVWWTQNVYKDRPVRGYYHGINSTANGIKTSIYIIVDREKWTNWLRDQISYLAGGDSSDHGNYIDDIVNTFIHEYQHLIQDISGSGKFTRQVTPKGKIDSDLKKSYQGYLARTSEIDSHATAAAAERVNQIIADAYQRHTRYGSYGSEWNLSSISDENWNELIQDELQHSFDNMPSAEFDKYILGLNRTYYNIDPKIKDQWLAKIKQRFLKTYMNRLRAYLRDVKQHKLATPVKPLPSE